MFWTTVCLHGFTRYLPSSLELQGVNGRRSNRQKSDYRNANRYLPPPPPLRLFATQNEPFRRYYSGTFKPTGYGTSIVFSVSHVSYWWGFKWDNTATNVSRTLCLYSRHVFILRKTCGASRMLANPHPSLGHNVRMHFSRSAHSSTRTKNTLMKQFAVNNRWVDILDKHPRIVFLSFI